MPRETINTTTVPFTIQVSWTPEQMLQLGVATTDGTHLVSQLFGDLSGLEEIGRRVAELSGYALSDNVDPDAERHFFQTYGREVLDAIEGSKISYHSVWSDLSRPDCNKLIRVLRRARGSVYGADE